MASVRFVDQQINLVSPKIFNAQSSKKWFYKIRYFMSNFTNKDEICTACNPATSFVSITLRNRDMVKINTAVVILKILVHRNFGNIIWEFEGSLSKVF